MTIANMKANTPMLNIWSTMLGLSPIALENVPSKKVLIVVNPSDPPTNSARPLEKGFKFVVFITILFSPHEISVPQGHNRFLYEADFYYI